MEQQTLTRCPRFGELAGEALVDDPPRGGRRATEGGRAYVGVHD